MQTEDLLYQLKIADEAITNLFEKQLGISLTRYQILQILLQESPLHQQALQEKLQIDRAAITRHLKILEETGYISRTRNPANQREMLVAPTPKAQRDLVEAPSSHHIAVKEAMNDILSQGEKQQLQSLLDKLLTGLQELPL